jgi:amino acid transporter
MAKEYEKNSITLPGAIAMGTGVMIGAGIFALTGQIAELAGSPATVRSGFCPLSWP